MRMRDARALTEFWSDCPPESEMLALLAQVYTTWKPPRSRETSPEDHQRSLEQRWAAGAMNAKQLLQAFGGAPVAIRSDGIAVPSTDVGSFPGAN